jgi:PKD repeat protein
MTHFRVYWLTCVLTLFAAAASATTIVLPTDKQLIAKSPLVVEGTVIRSEAVDRGEAIWTETTIAVERTLKGSAIGTVTVREVGGQLGDRITKIFGAPEYAVGERVMAFLTPTPRGDYQTMDLFVGKFSEQLTLSGRRVFVRDDAGADATLLDSNFQAISAKNLQRSADRFESYVAGGGTGDANYGIENGVLQRDVPMVVGVSGHLTPSDKFTLISDPTVFRWYAFDRGSSARWYTFGAQSGYSSGGVTEIQTAMNAWNSYTEAKISYSYAGAGSGTSPGNVRSNGTNDILFNDPNNEISGTYSGSSGGTVGVGGFNGTASSANWTSPFGADAQHSAGTFRAIEITEGNFVIQDGVSPTAGISSTLLAEIAAHELGHTLGFGHTSDNTALMYAYVTGRGPSLRADDQTAARWLYPNGTVTPPPTGTVPASPSSLVATGAPNSITLSWVDNANNETSQRIFLSYNNGSYGFAASVGANVTATTLTGLAPGTYRAYVTAANASGDSLGSNTATATVPVTVSAGFIVTPATQIGVAGQTTFTFTDNSIGTVTSRSWAFGDGSTSTQTNPSHVYNAAGFYTVTLTVTGSGGVTSQATKNISVSNPAPVVTVPVPNFTWVPTNPTYDQVIQFYDQTTGGVSSFSWSFGDGTFSTAQNPTHKYAGPSTYTVILTVANSAGTAGTSRTISIGSPAPVFPAVTAAFDAPASATARQTVSFTDQSTGSPTTWSWSFGDGSTSTAKNPTHAFTAAGTYTVSLIAANGGNGATTSHTIVINPIAPYRALVSVSAQTNGVSGSVWRTELTVFNGGDEAASGQYTFLPSVGGAVLTRSLFIAPRQSITFNNSLLELFGLDTGAGAIAVEATATNATPSLKVSSRTFTTGTVGTYGQAVPSVATDDLQSTLYLTGLEHDSAFRTNLGLVNRSSAAVGAALTLIDDSGRVVGTNSVVIQPNNFQQGSLANYFPAVTNGLTSRLSLRINAGATSALSAYASIVDNVTQDPVYVQAIPAPSGSSLVLPAVGRAPGANGTFWRSDVTLFNPTTSTLGFTLRYIAAGTDGRNAPSRNYALAPSTGSTFSDVLNIFGITSGSGALEVRWNATTGPVVTSRTYTSTTDGGTFGQSIDPVARFRADSYVTGLRSDASYRSNVGLVNGNDATIGVTVTLLSSFGTVAATNYVQIAPRSQAQYSLSALFPNVNASSLGSFTMQAHTDSGAVLFAYGSVVDNASGDPVFFAGQ